MTRVLFGIVLILLGLLGSYELAVLTPGPQFFASFCAGGYIGGGIGIIVFIRGPRDD